MRCLLLIIISVLFVQCDRTSQVESNPLSTELDIEVKKVLEKAWDNYGGWDAYQQMDSIIYSKRTILYLEDGAVEMESKQKHFIQLQPALEGSLVSSSNSDNKTILDQSGFYKMKDGKRVADSENSAQQSFLSSHFVLFAPFKITDPGTKLKYMGKDTLEGKIVDVIRATWDPEEHENHSTNDTWYLHFDQETGQYMSYMVYHAPTYAMVTNHEITYYKGLQLPSYRETWRVDSQGNRQYLRGKFWYTY